MAESKHSSEQEDLRALGDARAFFLSLDARTPGGKGLTRTLSNLCEGLEKIAWDVARNKSITHGQAATITSAASSNPSSTFHSSNRSTVHGVSLTWTAESQSQKGGGDDTRQRSASNLHPIYEEALLARPYVGKDDSNMTLGVDLQMHNSGSGEAVTEETERPWNAAVWRTSRDHAAQVPFAGPSWQFW